MRGWLGGGCGMGVHWGSRGRDREHVDGETDGMGVGRGAHCREEQGRVGLGAAGRHWHRTLTAVSRGQEPDLFCR